jgi:hypothetical protein
MCVPSRIEVVGDVLGDRQPHVVRVGTDDCRRDARDRDARDDPETE